MDISIILLLLAGGALLVPLLGGDDDEGGDSQIDGTFGDDNDPPLEGTEGNDLIRGFLGDDIINGNGGLDTLIGGEGEDQITGGEDRDVIQGGPDNDHLFGLGGNDTIEGGGGADFIDAGEGNDIVRAGGGNDIVIGNLGSDTLRGEDDDDDIFLWGDQGRAFGGDGDDELIMVTGRGVLDGIAGENTYYAFANDNDAQQTVAVIQELYTGDQIVMTIDTSDANALDAPLEVTVTEGTLNGVNGYNVAVSFVDENAVADGETFEEARVFIYGTSVPIETVVNSISVDVTLNAELTVEGAQATFAAVKAAAGAPAVTNPVVV